MSEFQKPFLPDNPPRKFNPDQLPKDPNFMMRMILGMIQEQLKEIQEATAYALKKLEAPE